MRAFYADLAAWAAEDPVRWGRFAAPSPVRASEITFTKIRRHRKAAMDQRTRTLAPVLPALVRQVQADLDAARQRLKAAMQVIDAVLLISGRATRKTQFPFGSVMIASAFLVVLVFVPPELWTLMETRPQLPGVPDRG